MSSIYCDYVAGVNEMAYQCWIGAKPEYRSELECVITLATKLEGLEDQFFLFVNFNVGHQIDLAVLKKNGIFIIELKNWKGRIRSKRNGPWELEVARGVFEPLGNKNPFDQVRRQYYDIANFLELNKNKFLSENKISNSSFGNIKSIIAISPVLNLDSESEDSPPIKIIAFNRLHDFLYEGVSRDIHLEESDILKLARILNLTRWNDIHDLVSPMTGPDEYDWKGYCEHLTTKLVEKLQFYIPLKAWISKPVPEKPFKAILRIIDPQEFINNNARIIVLGGPGSGKSMTLEYQVYRLAHNYLDHQSPLIPIIIPLSLYKSRLDGLLGLLHSSFRKYGVDIAVKALADILRRKYNFAFFFDGLNEISIDERSDALLDLRRFLMDYPHHKFVLSSSEQSEIFEIDEFQIVFLNPFSEEDVIRYLRSTFTHDGVADIDDMKLQQKAKIVGMDILSNPLCCYLYSFILREDPESVVSAVFRLFDKFVQIQFVKGRGQDTQIGIKSSTIKLALCSLANEMFDSGRYSLAEVEFDHVLKRMWSNSKEKEFLSCTFDNLRETLLASPFLVREEGKISFSHSRLQIYFSSILLAEKLVAKDLSAIDRLMDFYWNDVSLFALNQLSNAEVEKLLNQAASCDNFFLLAKCLTGVGGKQAQRRGYALIEELKKSFKQTDRILAVRMLGKARDSYEGFMGLLEILSSEELKLKDQFEQRGYTLYDKSWDSEISVDAFLDSQGSLSEFEKRHILSTDFKVFKEAEYFLRRLARGKKYRPFLNIIDEYEKYSITSRCWIVEIMSTIESEVDKESILDFLFSRIFKSHEKYIQVNSVADYVLSTDLEYGDLSIKKHPQTGEKPTLGSEALALWRWGKFEREEEIELLEPEASSGFWDILKILEGTKIVSESEISEYSEVLKYIVNIKNRNLLGKESFFDLLHYFRDPDGGIEEALFPLKALYTFLLEYLTKICLRGDGIALRAISEMGQETEPILKLFSLLGFEMMKHSGAAREIVQINRNIIDEHLEKTGEDLFVTYRYRALNSLTIIADCGLKMQSHSKINILDIIKRLLKDIPTRQLIEDLILETLLIENERRKYLLDWLFEIGNQESLIKLKRLVNRLEIECEDIEKMKSMILAMFARDEILNSIDAEKAFLNPVEKSGKKP